MEARNIPAFQTEDYMPPPSELKYRVLFIYSNGATENDPDKFWKSFAKKQNDEIESFVGKRAALEKTYEVIPDLQLDIKYQITTPAEKARYGLGRGFPIAKAAGEWFFVICLKST